MPIYTAGYGNLGFPAFLDRLRGLGITHLVDVRRLPFSRYWKDFARPRVDDLITEAGIRYVWMGDSIGGIGDREQPLDIHGEFDYRAIWSEPAFQKGLDKVVAASQKEGWKVCLMCGCLRPEGCHRGLLIGPAMLERGIDLLHVGADGDLVPQSESMVGVQAKLF